MSPTTSEDKHNKDEKDSCIIPSNLIPAADLSRYSVERDPHLEIQERNYIRHQFTEEAAQRKPM